MTRPKVSKVIPNELRRYLLAAYTHRYESPENQSRGKTGRYRAFTRVLNEYLLENRSTNEILEEIAQHFGPNGISEETVFSAFGLKGSGNNRDGRERDAASKQTRDLLCLFASDGQFDWDRTLTMQFPLHRDKLDASASELIRTIDDKADPSVNEGEFVRTIYIEADKFRSNNPAFPVFPPAPWYAPAWPATPTNVIQVPGFFDVQLKDESANPTGLHKDRMAWEIAVMAKRFEDQHGRAIDYSLITSGGAAISIQFFLNLVGTSTVLRALVDSTIDPVVKKAMLNIGCLVFETDLRSKELRPADIRRITENEDGIDLTYRATDVPGIEYYDWLSCEILNSEPDFCFIPFGTGELYTNVLRFLQKVYHQRFFFADLRLKANIDRLTKCHFYGATTNNPASKLTKLFAYHRPLFENHLNLVNNLRIDKIVGAGSSIQEVQEKFVDEAADIATRIGINCEPSGIAGLALLLQLRNQVNPNGRILIVNTGKTNLDPEPPPSKLSNKS